MDVDRYEMLRLPHEDRWGMLVGADDPLAALPSVTPADVRSARLVVPHRAGARSELAAWMGVDASPGSGLAFVPLEPPRAAGVCPRKRLPGGRLLVAGVASQGVPHHFEALQFRILVRCDARLLFGNGDLIHDRVDALQIR